MSLFAAFPDSPLIRQDVFSAGNALIAWEERTELEIQEILKQREESNKKLPGFQLK